MMKDSGGQTQAGASPGDLPDEAAVGELLRVAGRRDTPPEDFAHALRATLQSEWRVVVEAQRQRRQRQFFARAAAAAVAVVAVSLGLWLSLPSAVPVASVVQVSGAAASASPTVRSGERLMTAAGNRMAVLFDSGVALRLDEDTEVRVDSGEQVTVLRGAVYVDAGLESGRSAPLVVQTPYGDVRHVGTQYEVRVLDGGVSVSVREGRIALVRDDGTLQGTAGERLVVAANGNVEREVVAVDAPEWRWTNAVTPPYAIDNRPLPEFLAWAGRELGRIVVFASPATQAQAGQIVLRGSIEGLTPDQAVDAVLATTTLQAERPAGQLLIRD